MGSTAALQHALEIAKEFRQPLAAEILRAAFRFDLLVFVIEPGAERMVSVVNFDNKISERELQLMHPEPASFALWRQSMSPAEIKKDVGGLTDHQFAGFQKGRGEG